MQYPKYDFHIHTKYSNCGKESMDIPSIFSECQRLGLSAIGITEHFDSNSIDCIRMHKKIIEDIKNTETSLDVYLGAELNFLECDGNFALTGELASELGLEFIIAGTHETYIEKYDLTKIVDVQHRHHLMVCQNPMVEVLVHPYWLSHWQFSQKGWPLIKSMKIVPPSYARELGQVARDTNTAIEINSYSVLVDMGGEEFARSYTEYLSIVSEQGPKFSFASDAHDISQLRTIKKSWKAAELLGLSGDQIYQPTHS